MKKPLKMKSDAPDRFPTWYMQMYHTQHMEHIKLEEDSDLTNWFKEETKCKTKKKTKKKN